MRKQNGALGAKVFCSMRQTVASILWTGTRPGNLTTPATGKNTSGKAPVLVLGGGPGHGKKVMTDITPLPEISSSNLLAPQGAGTDAIGAQTDAQAAAVWIRAKGGRSPNTFDSYRREAIRLLLWLGENGLSLKEMKVDHAHLFFAHLASPPFHWLRPRKPRRDDVLAPTQVLAAPLSASSISHSRTILGGMCSYLQDAGYLQFNVFKLSMKPAVVVSEHQERALHLDSWFWLWDWVCNLSGRTARDQAGATRARWLFALLYHSGVRREEAAHGVMGDFVRMDRGWLLRVIGKGSKERMVAVNSILLKELMRYRKSWGLAEFPNPGEKFPLVASVNVGARSRGLTPRSVGLIVQELARAAAGDCPDEHIRNQIVRMTTHWMRHTNATHRLQAGATLETTQDELGHADPRTTRIYARTIDSKRQEDAQKLADLQSGHETALP